MKVRFADLMEVVTDDILVGWFPQCDTAAECRDVADFAIGQIELLRDMRIGEIEAEARREGDVGQDPSPFVSGGDGS